MGMWYYCSSQSYFVHGAHRAGFQSSSSRVSRNGTCTDDLSVAAAGAPLQGRH